MIDASESETERVHERRAEDRQENAAEILQQLKFSAQSSSKLAMRRLYAGGAGRGERDCEAVAKNFGENLTRLAAKSHSGVSALMSIERAREAIVFKIKVKEVLSPRLKYLDKFI